LSYSVGGPITDSAAPPVRDSCNNPSDKSIGSFLGGIKDRMFGKRKVSYTFVLCNSRLTYLVYNRLISLSPFTVFKLFV